MRLRALIRQMSIEIPLWGAPRIHGELLKLGIEVAQSSAAKYMVKRRGPPSQGWRTFLRNHAPDIAAMDLFVVPTIGFDLLYAFVIVRLDRRDLVWINVTTNPTAEWIARQITEAFPWDDAPQNTSSAIGITSMARSSHADCAPWASGTSPLHPLHLGKMALPNGWSDRSGTSVWTTSLSWARRICAVYSNLMPTITTVSELIDRWTRMRRFLGQFTGPVSFVHTPFWADCITNTFVFRFSVHTAPNRYFGAPH
jgi:hypothetical protein